MISPFIQFMPKVLTQGGCLNGDSSTRREHCQTRKPRKLPTTVSLTTLPRMLGGSLQ